MIDVPVEKIISKIKDEKGLSEEEIREKIKAKLTQLSGLISEEGAAHIVAKELGVNLILLSTGYSKINELKPGMRSANLVGKVTRKFEIREFDKGDRKGKVAAFFIGDETGQVRITLWNDQADKLNEINIGDIVKITNAFVKENRGFNEVHLASHSKLSLNPEGISIEVKKKEAFENKYPAAERKSISDLQGGETNVELLATIVQVYDPRFFKVCPECGKRALQEADDYKCPDHGSIKPNTNYVIGAFLDDGTGNIRATFWKAQSQHLTKKSDKELLKLKDDNSSFEKLRQELLGEIIKVKGSVKKNEAFDRLDFNVFIVERDIDPTEEIAKLDQQNSEETTEEKTEAKAEVQETKEEKPVVVMDDSEEEKEDKPSPVQEKKETSSENKEKPAVIKEDDIEKPEVEEEIISLDDLDDL